MRCEMSATAEGVVVAEPVILIVPGLLLLVRQYEVALSLAAGPGTAVNRHLGSPHNPGQLPVVLMALPVGCLSLATVQAGER